LEARRPAAIKTISAGTCLTSPLADRKERVGMAGLGEAQALLHHADHHAADHVDEQHQEAGDRVAAHEFRGAVHGAEEAAPQKPRKVTAGGKSCRTRAIAS
jgi:hypothetical protein